MYSEAHHLLGQSEMSWVCCGSAGGHLERKATGANDPCWMLGREKACLSCQCTHMGKVKITFEMTKLMQTHAIANKTQDLTN